MRDGEEERVGLKENFFFGNAFFLNLRSGFRMSDEVYLDAVRQGKEREREPDN
jgi:hypothetical protein